MLDPAQRRQPESQRPGVLPRGHARRDLRPHRQGRVGRSSGRCCRSPTRGSGSSSCSPNGRPEYRRFAQLTTDTVDADARRRRPRRAGELGSPPLRHRQPERRLRVHRSVPPCCRSFGSSPASTVRWSIVTNRRGRRPVPGELWRGRPRRHAAERARGRRTWPPCSTCTTPCSTPTSTGRRRSCRSATRSSATSPASSRRRTSVGSTSCTARPT